MYVLSDVRLGIVCPMANEGKSGLEFAVAVLEKCEGFREVTFFAILDKATRDKFFDVPMRGNGEIQDF